MATANNFNKAKSAPQITLRPGQYTFKLLQKITPNVAGAPPYPRKKCMPPTEVVFDDETNAPRMVRYLDGVNTIFVDEQNDKKIDTRWAEENTWTPTFDTGVMILNYPEDELKIRRMLLSDRFEGKLVKRNRAQVPVYALENKEQEAASNLEFKKQRKLAMDRAYKAIEDYESIIPHAKFLNIQFYDGSRLRTQDEIKEDYLTKSESDPLLFNKYYDSPMVMTTYLLKEALDNGSIDVTTSKGEAKWADTKATICKIDLTRPPIETLVEYSTSAEGKKFLDRLKRLADEAKG